MTKYKIEFEKTSIEFRVLTAEETDKFTPIIMQENPFAEEHVFNLVTEEKYNIDELEAGIVTAIVYIALKISGVVLKKEDFPELIISAREKVKTNVFNTLYVSIIKYMPRYSLDDLREKSLNEILELFSMAELISGNDIIDIDKLKAAYSSEDAKSKSTKKKGALSITKGELEALKAVLQSQEMDGRPLDGF